LNAIAVSRVLFTVTGLTAPGLTDGISPSSFPAVDKIEVFCTLIFKNPKPLKSSIFYTASSRKFTFKYEFFTISEMS
jgi:hypothetical protein